MKKAFTMIELVFVIVVIGILAATIIPNTQTNPAPEAAIKLVSSIRYTQHLALVDDKFEQSGHWYQNRWQLVFSGSGNNLYSIVSDKGNTYAKDPLNPQEDIDDVELKGVTLTLSGGCADKTIISFDNMGRPLVGSLAAVNSAVENLMDANCSINISDGSKHATVIIVPETGYVKSIL